MEPVLIVNDLSVTFANDNGGLAALTNVSFKVCPREFVCILGPSGSGKSTLLRVLAGLLRQSSGEVCYQGEKLNGPQREFGVVFQNANLMPWRSVFENITLPMEVHGLSADQRVQRAQDLIELVGLQGFEKSLPRDLSGGMEQLVAIARSLAHEPELLLMDEPFGHLDALTRDQMGAELLRIWQARRKTVIMITHSIPEAVFLADRILVLSPRPGNVRLDLHIQLPRPRIESIRYTADFGSYAKQIRDAIG